MKLSSSQTDVASLTQFGREAVAMVERRDFSALAERFGYALSYDRDPALAIENGVDISIFNLPFMLYVFSMVVILGICFIRGALIGKRWLVMIPTVAFVFNLTPSLSMIPFVPYVYHFLALTLGAVCPLLTVSTPDTVMKYDGC